MGSRETAGAWLGCLRGSSAGTGRSLVALASSEYGAGSTSGLDPAKRVAMGLALRGGGGSA